MEPSAGDGRRISELRLCKPITVGIVAKAQLTVNVISGRPNAIKTANPKLNQRMKRPWFPSALLGFKIVFRALVYKKNFLIYGISRYPNPTPL
jgi:hypothetical protein